MSETILGATGTLYGWLLTYLLHSAVLLVGVWVLVRLGWVRRPATQDVLWKVALFGSILTATAGTLRDAPTRAERPKALTIQTVHPTAVAPPTTETSAPADAPGLAVWHTSDPAAADVALKGNFAEPTETCRSALANLPADHSAWPGILKDACPTPRAFLWQHGVVFFWMLGALLAAALLTRRRLALRDALGQLRRAGPRSRRALGRVMKEGPRVRARLVASTTADAPCVIRGNTIVLPERCEEQLSDDELDAVLAHELAHVERRDVIWLSMLRALEAIFWFQPLNRMGVVGSLTATELECDDQALARTGQPLGLARSLARVAEWSLPRSRLRPDVALARGKGHHLTARVRRILAPARPEGRGSRGGRVLAACLLMAPAFLLPSVPGAPIVRRDILYRVETADGGAPVVMLLKAVEELEAIPGDLEESARRLQVKRASPMGN